MTTISFFVPGVPIPKGSAKAFVNKRTMRAIVTQTNGDKQKPWASLIALSAQQAMNGAPPAAGPLKIALTFNMPRPKNHFGTGKKADALKDSAPLYHTSKPDLDKLIRCVKDALTGVVWNDDSQVCIVNAMKIYTSKPGVSVLIEEIL